MEPLLNPAKTFASALIATLSLMPAGGAYAEPDFPRVNTLDNQVPVPRVRPMEDPAAFLRLRPLKEAAPCTGTGDTGCPLVTAPRINKRHSTIPGTSQPDYGRPSVPILQPPAGGYASKYRSFGGNRGITGGY